jgi:hypothetical protein
VRLPSCFEVVQNRAATGSRSPGMRIRIALAAWLAIAALVAAGCGGYGDGGGGSRTPHSGTTTSEGKGY